MFNRPKPKKNWRPIDSNFEKNLSYWKHLSEVDPDYIGFYIKFSKHTLIDERQCIVRGETMFTGKIFPDFSQRFPDLFKAISAQFDTYIVNPIADLISKDVDGMMTEIASGRMLVLTAIFKLTLSEDFEIFEVEEKFKSLSSHTEQQVMALGVFN